MFDRVTIFILKYLICALLVAAITALGELVLPGVFNSTLTKISVIHLLLTLIVILIICAITTIIDLTKG